MFAPEGRFSTFLGNDLKWESGCTKPYWPSAGSDYGRQSAETEYQIYQDCLVSHAKSDTEYASDAIIDSAKKELAEVQEKGEMAGYKFR